MSRSQLTAYRLRMVSEGIVPKHVNFQDKFWIQSFCIVLRFKQMTMNSFQDLPNSWQVLVGKGKRPTFALQIERMPNANEALINQFYQGFQKLNPTEMCACYHSQVVFEDPAFGVLQGERANMMWHMLVERGKESLQIEFNSVEANENTGAANWTATYLYGKDKRKVTNQVKANFEFKDGYIIRHKDHFDLWKWSQQALGFSGYTLGWSGFMKKKIQATTAKALSHYISQKKP